VEVPTRRLRNESRGAVWPAAWGERRSGARRRRLRRSVVFHGRRQAVRTDARAARTALAHGAGHDGRSRERALNPQDFDGGARVGRCHPRPLHHRWGRAHRQLRDQPRPVRPLPAARGLARAGPPAQPRAPLEPRTAKHRGAPTAIRASNAQAFRVSAKCADLRATPPPEATAPAIRHDSTRKASR
jgi:hypothetical protein